MSACPWHMQIYLFDGSAVNEVKLRDNLMAAADVYIRRCKGAPCGDAQIHLFHGSDSSSKQTLRPLLLKFLKGTQKQKAV